MEPELRFLVELVQALLCGISNPQLLRISSRLILDLNTGLIRQVTQRFGELQSLLLLHESKDIAPLIATKAMPGLCLGEDMKRWGTLVVQGAETLKTSAGLLQANNQPDLFDNINLCFDGLDKRCHLLFL